MMSKALALFRVKVTMEFIMVTVPTINLGCSYSKTDNGKHIFTCTLALHANFYFGMNPLDSRYFHVQFQCSPFLKQGVYRG